MTNAYHLDKIKYHLEKLTYHLGRLGIAPGQVINQELLDNPQAAIEEISINNCYLFKHVPDPANDWARKAVLNMLGV